MHDIVLKEMYATDQNHLSDTVIVMLIKNL